MKYIIILIVGLVGGSLITLWGSGKLKTGEGSGEYNREVLMETTVNIGDLLKSELVEDKYEDTTDYGDVEDSEEEESEILDASSPEITESDIVAGSIFKQSYDWSVNPDPFGDGKHKIEPIEVLEVKDGWVKYDIDGTTLTHEIAEIIERGWWRKG